MIRFHYIYKMTRIDTGEYYIGMRSSRVRPEEDSYLGSGLRLRAAVKRHGRESLAAFHARRRASKLIEEVQ